MEIMQVGQQVHNFNSHLEIHKVSPHSKIQTRLPKDLQEVCQTKEAEGLEEECLLVQFEGEEDQDLLPCLKTGSQLLHSQALQCHLNMLKKRR